MNIKSTLFFAVLIGLTVISSCNKKKTTPNLKERNTTYINNKADGWILESIVLPSNSATIEDDWTNFTLTSSSTMMNTSGHATGAEAVWPSSSWIINDEGNEITRTTDNVVMKIVNISESTLIVTFAISGDVHLNARIAALGGDYTFTLH